MNASANCPPRAEGAALKRLRFVLALPFCTLTVAAGLLGFLSITIAALFARAARRIIG